MRCYGVRWKVRTRWLGPDGAIWGWGYVVVLREDFSLFC